MLVLALSACCCMNVVYGGLDWFVPVSDLSKIDVSTNGGEWVKGRSLCVRESGSITIPKGYIWICMYNTCTRIYMCINLLY